MFILRSLGTYLLVVDFGSFALSRTQSPCRIFTQHWGETEKGGNWIFKNTFIWVCSFPSDMGFFINNIPWRVRDLGQEDFSFWGLVGLLLVAGIVRSRKSRTVSQILFGTRSGLTNKYVKLKCYIQSSLNQLLNKINLHSSEFHILYQRGTEKRE